MLCLFFSRANKLLRAVAVALALGCVAVPVAAVAPPDPAAGDNRLATLGDLKEFQRETRKDNRALLEIIVAQNQRIDQLSQRIAQQNQRIDQLNQRIDMLNLGIQDGMNLIWATMLGGFIALFVAFMTASREKKSATAPDHQQPAAKPQRPPLFDGTKPAIAAAIFALAFPIIIALSQ